jgi:polyisoprenoid-binding protein YceI
LIYAVIGLILVTPKVHLALILSRSKIQHANQMKKLTIITALSLSAFLYAFKTMAPSTWTVDKMHAKIGFSITHNMASDVEGSFKNFDATITTTGDDFTGASFDFTADPASITTDNERRDKDIKSTHFLDVVKYSGLTFKSTSVTKNSTSTYKIAGNLTMHGVTKAIILDALVRIPPAATGVKGVAGFKISGVIRRSDFDIGAGFANLILGDEVTLTANGEFVKH